MRKLIIFMTMLFLALSCSSTKSTTENETKEVSTVYVNKVIHDTVREKGRTIIIPPIKTVIKIPCDEKDYNQSINTGKSKVNVNKKDGVVTIDLDIDSIVDHYKEINSKRVIKLDSISNSKKDTKSPKALRELYLQEKFLNHIQ